MYLPLLSFRFSLFWGSPQPCHPRASYPRAFYPRVSFFPLLLSFYLLTASQVALLVEVSLVEPNPLKNNQTNQRAVTTQSTVIDEGCTRGDARVPL